MIAALAILSALALAVALILAFTVRPPQTFPL